MQLNAECSRLRGELAAQPPPHLAWVDRLFFRMRDDPRVSYRVLEGTAILLAFPCSEVLIYRRNCVFVSVQNAV